ncbi:MAG: hypothetical protein ACK5XN_07345, partial [Bacteroidota bacterium]
NNIDDFGDGINGKILTDQIQKQFVKLRDEIYNATDKQVELYQVYQVGTLSKIGLTDKNLGVGVGDYKFK